MPLASRATQTVPLHVLIFTKTYQVLTTRADYAQKEMLEVSVVTWYTSR